MSQTKLSANAKQSVKVETKQSVPIQKESETIASWENSVRLIRKTPRDPILSAVAKTAGLQRSIGNQSLGRLNAVASSIQRTGNAASISIQRTCACGNKTDSMNGCHECKAKRLALQRKEGAITHDSIASKTSVNYLLQLRRFGENPGCTDVQSRVIHQSINQAKRWVNRALQKLEVTPLSAKTLASLRRNFGPTYGVRANVPLIAGRLRTAHRELSTIPFKCADATDSICADGNCGYTTRSGSHAAVICTHTLHNGHAVFTTGCLLHESMHAAFSRFTIDEYSGWNGHSSSMATYPGTGKDPLLNADSYTTLIMDLS